MKLIETKGDVKFYEIEGKQFQEVNTNFHPVCDGEMRYQNITIVNKHIIQYNLNGIHGYSIYKNGRRLEDNIWTLKEAERIAQEL